MKKSLYTFLLATSIITSCNDKKESTEAPLMTIKQYPVSAKEEKTLDFFGTSVSDPYMWLENDTAANTEAWVNEQIALTTGYLDSIPFRQKIKERFTELFNFEKVGAPIKAGDYYFMFRNSGLEPQGKYFVRNGATGAEEVFLDVNALSPEGTTSAGLLGADDSNRYMAVSVNEAGSDWGRIEVFDIATKTRMADRLEWVKFSGATWYKE